MPMPRTRTALLAAALAVTAACHKKTGTVRVAAAADLAKAFKEVSAAFEKKTGKKVDLMLGSTGQFAQKIAADAPYDVFAAANVSFVEDVIKSGDCDETTKAMYARGRIVMWSKGQAPAALTDLTDPSIHHIAIANPDHAPYGRAAKQALESAGVWDAVKDKVVYGSNVQQTFQFAQTGNAEVGIVALSLAIGDDSGHYTEIPENMHKPLDQALVVCTHGNQTAAGRAFASFVNSPEGREIMKKYGFRLPGEG